MRARSLFIAALLALQLAVPLRYYASADRYDERFAWRMFSPVRAARCRVEFTRDGAPVSLHATFHSAWSNLATRARPDVLDAMARTLCADAQDVRLSLACTEPGTEAATARPLARGERNLCTGDS